MLVKCPSCLSKLTMFKLVKSHHDCCGIRNKTNWHQELTYWIWLMKYPLVNPKFSLVLGETVWNPPFFTLGDFRHFHPWLDSENLGYTSGISVEVGGKGAGKVDLLHISQAKRILCIYTKIRNTKKLANKSNKMYYPSKKLILAHFIHYMDVTHLNLHLLSANR